ncbi:MAG: thioesterase domain-containing protein, partial [Acidobacteriota bacterium]
ANALAERGQAPARLLLSGCRPPEGPLRPSRSGLDDGALIEQLRALGGTPEIVFQHAELMQVLLPIFRADLDVIDTYRPAERAPLACPVRVYGGDADRDVPVESLAAWRRFTSDDFTTTTYPGGHFYLPGDAAPALLGAVRREVLGAPAG